MDTNIKMNTLSDAAVKMLEIKGHEVQCFEDNEPGFENQYVVDVEFNGKAYTLIFQAIAPVYMSRDFLDREQGDYRITDFGLDPIETGDNASDLAEAIGKFDGVASNDFDEAAYLEDITNLICSKIKMEGGYDASDE